MAIPKSIITVSDAGLKPLKLRLVVERELKEPYERLRPKGIDLVELSSKLTDGKTRSPSITQLRKKKRDGEGRVEDVFKDFGYLPSVLCNKCDYNSTCPYFARYQVCQFVTVFFASAPRFMHKFIPHIMMYINDRVWHSSILTDEQTWYDSLTVITASYVLLRVIKDQSMPDHKPLYKGTYKDKKYGGRLRDMKTQGDAKELQDLKRRQSLGMLHVSSFDRHSAFSLDENINKQFYWQPYTDFEEITK